MKKELPKVKKSLKSFILDEDAKVMDKTATKLSILGSFMAFNFLMNSSEVRGFGHTSHSEHSNNLNAPLNYGTGIHAGNNPTNYEVNSIPSKMVETWHSNHYFHSDESGPSLLFIVIIMSFGITLLDPALIVSGSIISALLMQGDDIDSIDTGTPNCIPEYILTLLKEEEE